MSKKILAIIISIMVFILIIIGMILWYVLSIKPVNKDDDTNVVIEIQSGDSTQEILSNLKEKGLIKNTLVSKVYIKLNGIKGLQAGKYELSPNMDLNQVLNKIGSGNVLNEEVKITFLEGKNMRWIAKTIAEKTNNTEEQVYEVLEDKEYIETLINKYWFITDEVLKNDIYYPLEGYLYPETYTFENANVTVKEIFNRLLDQTDKVLTKYKTQIDSLGGTVHQILTFASIVELEGNDSTSREGIASVIYNRLKKKMSLGSDVTTYYAIKVDMEERNLTTKEINTYNPYNTRGPKMEGKLPIGPIAMISEEALKAVLEPAETDYLYFVADMNGKIYFTKTYEEHQEMIKKLQKEGLWYEYNE